uniref:Aldo-keto reductase n=1 Tax=Cyberlindnera americana TaxID=36016 RepID=A0A5P8N960_9ASCO|nr:aldo-keto reductase [Cyberlindnera americana]
MALHKDSKYKLNNGLEIPVSGFGVYQTPPDVTTTIVYEALKAGYRHIDSARAYRNEKESAEGIAKFLKEFPDVKRSDIFFTSKVNNKTPTSHEEAARQLQESYDLIKDNAGYFDLFLIHSTYPDAATRFNQYKALQDFVDAGKIKSIGVSNYGTRHLDELFSWDGLKYKPVVNQVELHPWLPRIDLQTYAKKYDFILEAYSPLTQGEKFNDPELVAIAKKHGKTPAQILLRWSYDQGFVPLAKTVTVSRIYENYNVLDNVVLDDEDKKILHKPASYEVLTWDPTVWVDPKK